MVFDRYTIEKFKESWSRLLGSGSDGLMQLGALCNASRTARAVSMGGVLFVILLIMGLVALLKPGPSTSVSKQLTLTATDSDGSKWVMDYLKGQNIQAILNGETKPGQPLTVTVKFHRQSQRILLIKPEVTGAAGEKYFPGTVKNGKWLEPPKLTIVDQAGKLLHQGQFEYG